MATSSPDPARDGESRVGMIIAVLVVASVVSTLVVLLRCYSRAIVLRNFGLDDTIIVPAQILTIASAVAIGLAEAKWGLGRHAWTMPKEHIITYMKASRRSNWFFYISIIVYNVAVCMTKISILLQYRRIFSSTWLRHLIIIGLVFLTCWGVTLCFLLPLVCIPVAAFWDPDVEGFCLDNVTVWYVMAGVNIATDIALFCMPIPVISTLRLPKRQKALLFFVFTLGIFPCAVSIYRIKTLREAAKTRDATWHNVNAAIFSFLELSVGVITVCLPTLRPVLRRAWPQAFGHALRSYTNGDSEEGGDSTGGSPSRNPLRREESRASAAAATKTTTLRRSDTDSTEGLRFDHPISSRLEHDIEFGDMSPSEHNPGARRYNVKEWHPELEHTANTASEPPPPPADSGGLPRIPTPAVLAARKGSLATVEEDWGREVEREMGAVG
ncbi:uncharacterized protein B0T15DRAFT_392688 [Chaetomium strumarium]|uniref:Rhodopsin domain-containing protein n=1 Tax=Chaetomium strumarium TaxID=1170767 RepID=A0AAJ0M485_9PEZI|nr:hypothetical protein B0T15DRAFT_392688 [Chaetomium strumarium]